jgi:hypothetical protein
VSDTRKVSARITTKDHQALKQLAAQHSTTVENLLKLGITLLPSALLSKKNIERLEPDHRVSR